MLKVSNALQAFTRLMSDEYTDEDQALQLDDIDAGTVLNALTELSNLEEQVGMPLHDFFDNPALKLEELKEGMWVWDNSHEIYLQIDEDFKQGNDSIIVVVFNDFHNCKCEYTTFEDNRFYRRKVMQ